MIEHSRTTAGRPAPARWLLAALVLLALVVVVAWLLRGQLLPAAARFLDVGRTPQPADGVLVLGGSYETRPFMAAALVRTGYAREVLLVQSPALPEERRVALPEHDVARAILLVREVPATAIQMLPGECRNTFDEALLASEFLAQRPDYRLIVVTNTFHTRRARWIFRQVLAERAEDVQFVSAPTDAFDASNWWHFDDGFTTYLKEYARLAFYLARYGIWGVVLLSVLLIVLTAACWRFYRRGHPGRDGN